MCVFFFSSRRRHTRFDCDWSSDVCSSDLFTVGGPIVLGKFYNGHDKTFFFFSFEQYRESQFITNGIATVPTLAYRRGDFSGALIPCLPSDPACLSNGVRGLTIGGVLARDPLGRFVPQNAI